MPIKGAKYRWKTYSSGKKVRLTFVKNKVVETKKPHEAAKMVTSPSGSKRRSSR